MKTAVVTGASTGIGEACARLLAKKGWHVFVVARRKERIEKIATEIKGQAIAVDVGLVQEADFATIKTCDLLINCAGGALGLDSIKSAKIEDWLTMYHNNVLGTLRMTQLLLDRLIQAQGCIINITSSAALGGYEGGGGYCAAKSAQRSMTQALRLEMKGVPIRVTEVLPGLVHTPEFSLTRFNGDAEKAQKTYENVDRPLTSEDVAQVVVDVANLPSHVNIDEIVVRPVAQRAHFSLFRGDLHWHE